MGWNITGSGTPFDYKNIQQGTVFGLLEHIRRLISASVTYGKDLKDCWGEAYISATGRNTSVSTADTTAVFSTNKYICEREIPTGNTENDNNTTVGGVSESAITYNVTLLKEGIFTVLKAKHVSSSSHTLTFYVKSSDGATTYATKTLTTSTNGIVSVSLVKSDYTGLPNGVLPIGTYQINITCTASYLGVNTTTYSFSGTYTSYSSALIPANGGDTTFCYTFTEYTSIGTGIITHTIPTGILKPNISQACIKSLVIQTETGASVQHKLTNATDDSGWMDDGIMTAFNTFSGEPTKLITRLIPKTTSPTDSYPCVMGVAVNVI